MNMLRFEKDGLKWSRVANNIWGAMVEPKDYLFIEVTPINGKYKLIYRNVEIKDYTSLEKKLMRRIYNIGPKADFTLAYVLGQHYNHYEWIEECSDYKALKELFELQTSFDVAFLGDVDAEGIPDRNKNIFGKVI